MIFEFLNFTKECRHDSVTPDKEGGYCQECGEYVQNKWYLVRCSCCNVKRIGYTNFNNEVKPKGKFCHNCGSKEFHIEELDSINFIDINFAVLKKEVISSGIADARSQIWINEKENEPQKLIGQSL